MSITLQEMCPMTLPTQSPCVALYARASTDDDNVQVQEVVPSISVQLAEMREYAQGRGWVVVNEFVDSGHPGAAIEDRPGLSAALENARQGDFDVLLVYKLSRLSRRFPDACAIFEQLGQYQVGFASVKDENLGFSPTGSLTFLAALNRYYADLHRAQSIEGKRKRARAGLYNASILPYGYAHTGDSDTPPVIVEKEAVMVRKAFELYATGEYSYQGVANWLTNAGFTTRAGANFSKDTIADMLRNPFYKGMVHYRQGKRAQDAGEVFAGQHEPLVPEELWEACRQIREQRRPTARTRQSKRRVYLLNKLATCDVCGRKLRVQGSKKGSYYREASRLRGFADCPSAGHGARMEWANEQVDAVLRRLRLPSDWQDDLQALAKGDASGALEELADVWDQMELADRRDLLRLALREVAVDVPQARVVSLEPYPTFAPLFRRIPLLREAASGVFVPVWPLGLAQELRRLELLSAAETPLDPQRALDWPLVVELPVAVAGQRINPILSKWLKARHKGGHEIGRIVELAHPTAPPLQCDSRKWPRVQIERVSSLDSLPAGAVEFLWTPFAVQRTANRPALLSAVERVVVPGGTWAFVDAMPASMPTHWLYRFFPEAWENERQRTLDASQMYNDLAAVEGEFEVRLERRTFYRPIELGEILRVARQREQVRQLADLPDPVYRTRLGDLDEVVQREGEGKVVVSEFCLAEVSVVRE
jgi:DNA invertase Pin-like site-specific DNA recombinase